MTEIALTYAFPGPRGPRGLPGTPGVGQWAGPWEELTSYLSSDIVTHAGHTFYALAPIPAGITPNPDTGPWSLLARGGATGAKGDQGDVGIRWMEAWDLTLPYVARDVVVHEGNVYLASLDVQVGIEPTADPETEPWHLLVSRGEQGIQGESFLNVDGGNATTNFNTLDVIDGGGA